MRSLTPARAALAAGLGVAASLSLGRACHAGDQITYKVNQTVGSGGVTGQIVTDGKTGQLSQSDILAWDLMLKGKGTTIDLSSSGGQSAVQIVGGDVTATSTQLRFNFSGTDQGYLLFQSNSPGLFSGAKYYCDNTTSSVCFKGVAVVPVTFDNSSTITDMTVSGDTVIGLASGGSSGPAISAADVLNSIQALMDARMAQQLVGQLYSQVLLGLNEQVSCGDCGGGSASVGSFNLAAHGRHALSPEWTVLGGLQIGQYGERGAQVNLNTGFAAALQYDPANMGTSRPYAEAGVSASYQRTTYHRSYPDGAGGVAVGEGTAGGGEVGAFGELGWVDRLTPRDEAAAYVSYSRLWQIVNGYTEATGPNNPLGATLPGGTDVTDVAAVGAQFTHMLAPRLEANLNASADWAFNSQSGLRAQVADLTVAGGRTAFVYYGAGGRLSWRLTRAMTGDLFVDGVLAPRRIGSSVHGGVGLRWSF